MADERECARLVPTQIIEQYAMQFPADSVRGVCHRIWLPGEAPDHGNAIPSPYVAMSQSFSKQANNLW